MNGGRCLIHRELWRGCAYVPLLVPIVGLNIQHLNAEQVAANIKFAAVIKKRVDVLLQDVRFVYRFWRVTHYVVYGLRCRFEHLNPSPTVSVLAWLQEPSFWLLWGWFWFWYRFFFISLHNMNFLLPIKSCQMVSVWDILTWVLLLFAVVPQQIFMKHLFWCNLEIIGDVVVEYNILWY